MKFQYLILLPWLNCLGDVGIDDIMWVIRVWTGFVWLRIGSFVWHF
jgi:hypothetical protein